MILVTHSQINMLIINVKFPFFKFMTNVKSVVSINSLLVFRKALLDTCFNVHTDFWYISEKFIYSLFSFNIRLGIAKNINR